VVVVVVVVGLGWVNDEWMHACMSIDDLQDGWKERLLSFFLS